jgi:hypothetical protein
LEKLKTTNNPNKITDIAVGLSKKKKKKKIYASQTFRRRIYQLNWERKNFDLIWSDNSPFGTIDSLSAGENSFYFVYEGSTASMNFENHVKQERQDITESIKKLQLYNRANTRLNSVVMYENPGRKDSLFIALHELYLLKEPEPGQPIPPSTHIAANKEGIYVPMGYALDINSFQPYLNTIERGGLNMIVIDMKDDYGRLRFTPNNPEITAKGRVFRPMEIDSFLKEMKNRGIFTVARIVVFKDRELAGKENGRFAVWDARNARPWVGYLDRRRRAEDVTERERNNSLIQIIPAAEEGFVIVRTFYDENWVDPYSEEVWEYIAMISEELHERGFDEIQYDYIRFPTDGDNLGSASYRWRDEGMDMESAILSFIRHARGRVKAPISIDIYGANGWYRTGARTGQEVETLAPWVDIICPMYYPSHFEQYFLAQPPAELRPWRIYYIGALRNDRIARGQVVIRSWAQAFSLNVSYDRQYYNADYVRRQLEGVRQAGSGGLTYWNNIGRYDEVPNK